MGLRSSLKFVVTVIGALWVFSAPAHALIITTPFDTDNGQRGIMFDVVVGDNAVIIDELAVDIYADTTADYEFYTVLGGIAGNINNAAAWTLRDTFEDVEGSATGTEDFFDLTNFSIGANTVVGFYFTNTVSGGVNYTNAPAVGDVRADDGNIQILAGVGKSYPFETTFTARNFNGSILYTLDESGSEVPAPASLALVLLGLAGMRRIKR
jgi:hypothetical protein